MALESASDENRKTAMVIEQQKRAEEYRRTGLKNKPFYVETSTEFNRKYPNVSVDPAIEDDFLMIGRSELVEIPQLAQYMDEQGNFKDLAQAEELLSKMNCTLSTGQGRKGKQFLFNRIAIDPNGTGIRMGVRSGVKMRTTKAGIMNPEIQFNFDNEAKKGRFRILEQRSPDDFEEAGDEILLPPLPEEDILPKN